MTLRVSSCSASTSQSIEIGDEELGKVGSVLQADFELPLHFDDLSKKRVSDTSPSSLMVSITPYEDARDLIRSSVTESWWDPDEDTFSVMYSLVRQYEKLTQDEKRSLVATIINGLRAALAMANGELACSGKRYLLNTAKAVVLFASNVVRIAEQVEFAQTNKERRQLGWTWAVEGRGDLLSELHSIMECRKITQAWGSNGADESFMNLFIRCTLNVLENPTIAKDKAVKELCLQILVGVVREEQTHGSVVSALLRLLVAHEHSAAVLSSLLEMHYDEKSESKFLDLFVDTMVGMEDREMGKDGTAGKNLGSFLAQTGNKIPKFISSYMQKLVSMFERESYQTRNGMVESVGHLIRHEYAEAKAENVNAETKSQRLEIISALFSAIMIRTKDVNAFARSRVLQVLCGLVEDECVQAVHFVEITKLGLLHMHDKAAAVRKSSLVLLMRMLEFNPFSPQLSGSTVKFISRMQGDSAVEFAECMGEACSSALLLIRSSSITDVQSAISFLVTAIKFQVPGTDGANRQLLPLLLSHEVSVRECALKAFEAMLHSSEADERLRAMKTAQLLLQLTRGATVGQLTCVSELFSGARILDAAVFQVLLDIGSDKVPSVPLESRRVAIELVSIAVQVGSPLVRARDVPVSELLRYESDPTVCRNLCSFAAVVCADDKTATAIEELLLREVAETDALWIPVADQAFRALMSCSPEPEKAAERVLRRLSQRFLATKKEADLLKAVFSVGQISIQQLIRIESTRQVIRKQKRETESEAGTLYEQLGEGHAALEAELEHALEEGEQEILEEGSLIRRFIPILCRLCGDSFGNASLRTTAAISLAKLMSTCETTCREHLRLVFSLLKSAVEPSVRRNLIIAIGDLTFRFPNLLEPWTDAIFSTLEDTDASVRKNAALTITHLILNDMLKVRGQIVSVVVLLHDLDDRISELVRMFFCELSKKSGHVIYNIIPDVLSGLFHRRKLDDNDFRDVMKFLISFVKDRERQAEGTIERLCHRFRSVNNIEDARRIACCLTNFNYSDRCFRKLSAMYRCYSEFLFDEEVNELFSTITTKAKRFPKQQLRMELDEFQSKLDSAVDGTRNDLNAKLKDVSESLSRVALQDVTSSVTNASSPHGNAAKQEKRSAKGLASAGRSRKRRTRLEGEFSEESGAESQVPESDEDVDDEEPEHHVKLDDVPNEPLSARPSVRTKRRGVGLRSAERSRRRRVVVSMDSDDSADDYDSEASYGVE
ncbi:hypothetical protein NDN08_001504 [Rhodosorus marinus]|uniref:Condensin complex subunit 1 n=1 Tax=Rhodosorus marinus TaxID=101924 RepID=A0AAV8UV70_9RHOD|nr:hypothetical protein NDN08_001504 [Rhodosorus marinus]